MINHNVPKAINGESILSFESRCANSQAIDILAMVADRINAHQENTNAYVHASSQYLRSTEIGVPTAVQNPLSPQAQPSPALYPQQVSTRCVSIPSCIPNQGIDASRLTSSPTTNFIPTTNFALTPTSSLTNSLANMTTNTSSASSKRRQRCPKCMEYKKGHICKIRQRPLTLLSALSMSSSATGVGATGASVTSSTQQSHNRNRGSPIFPFPSELFQGYALYAPDR